MRKRRFPSWGRRGRETEGGDVGFQDLPADEADAGVVTHAASEGEEPAADAEGPAAVPTLPGSAVIIHPATPAPAEVPLEEVLDGPEAAYAPPAPTEADEDAEGGPGPGEADGGAAAAVPDVILDEGVRRDVVLMVGASAFVDGPPGAGKTGLLVDRVVECVRRGEATIDRVVVVTASDDAAAALAARLRGALERALGAEPEEQSRHRLGAALAGLRTASIGVPGRIAADILARRCVQAGVDPEFRVMDVGEARLRFEEQWRAWLAASGTDGDVERALRRGLSLRQIRRLAETVTAHRALLPRGEDETGEAFDLAAFRLEVEEAVAELARLAASGAEEDDGVVQIRALQRWWEDAAALDGDDFVGHLLGTAPVKIRQAGSRAHWDPAADCARQMAVCKSLAVTWSRARRSLGRSTLDAALSTVTAFVRSAAADRRRAGALTETDVLVEVRNLLADDEDVRSRERDLVDAVLVDDVWDVDPVALQIVRLLTGGDGDASQVPSPGRLYVTGSRCAAIGARGDLRPVLQLAEALAESARTVQVQFRTRPEILAWANDAFGELFGTDPECQVPFTAALPAPAPNAGESAADGTEEGGGEDAGEVAAAPSPWARPGPDPAEPPEDQAPETETADPQKALTTNEIPLLRPGSEESVGDGDVIRVLTPEGREMEVTAAEVEQASADAAAPGAGEAAPGEPESDEPASEVVAVAASLDEWPRPEDWTPVVAVTVPSQGDGPDAVRRGEAFAAAEALRRLVDSGAPLLRDGNGDAGPAAWRDCAVLAVSPAGLHEYEAAFDTAGIPLHVPSRHDGLDRPEVDDLVAVLRAADEPGDTAAVVAALRGLAFGCSDDDLVRARAEGCTLDPLSASGPEVPEPVRHGLDVLAALHARRSDSAPELVASALSATGILQAAASLDDGGRAAASLTRVRDLAWQVCGAEAAPVRHLLRWIDTRPRRGHRGTDEMTSQADAVLLTTVDAAAAGHPVVVLVNTMPAPSVMPLSIPDHVLGRLHTRVGLPERGVTTPGFDAALGPDDDRFVAARTRLAYAGASLARDVLVVPVAIGDAESSSREPHRRDLRRRIARHLLASAPGADTPAPHPGITVARLGRGAPDRPAWPVSAADEPHEADAQRVLQGWREERDALLREAARLPAATAAGDEAPVGRSAAFRSALARVDFAGDADVAALAAAACAEAGVPALAGEVAQLLDAALSTQVLHRAAAAQHLLRRPTVALDGGEAGAFWSRVDFAFDEDGALVTVQVDLGGEGGVSPETLALATHGLAQAAGLPVGEAVVLEVPGGDSTSLGAADVAALAGKVLTVERPPAARAAPEPGGDLTEVLEPTDLPETRDDEERAGGGRTSGDAGAGGAEEPPDGGDEPA